MLKEDFYELLKALLEFAIALVAFIGISLMLVGCIICIANIILLNVRFASIGSLIILTGTLAYFTFGKSTDENRKMRIVKQNIAVAIIVPFFVLITLSFLKG